MHRRQIARLLPSLSFALLFLPGVAVAQTTKAASQPETLLFTFGDDKGAFDYRVPDARLMSTKQWEPEVEPTPLSIAAALKIAKKRQKPARPDDMKLVSVDLKQVEVGNGRLEDARVRWYYTLELQDTSRPCDDSVRVVMLMDGSVVEPTPFRPEADSLKESRP